MNRTLRAILAVIFIGIITLSAISICQNIAGRLRADITEQKLYTLSAGTKSILSRLRQPVKVKLYYTKTAAMKAPDQIRFFNNYYYFVESLLQEYFAAARGMIELQIIDPRPFSDDEADALRYGLTRLPMTEEEGFFFGLVVQTQFGVTKTIPFFSPDRQNFIEYDISYLIDTAISRQKRRIGVLGSLPVMGEDVSGYMAQMMRMQGQRPKAPWTIVEQLRGKYQVAKVDTNVEEINDVDILLVIHPKDLPEKTLFAIDQFVLRGGRTIVCVDPYCFADRPQQMQTLQQQTQQSNSNLQPLMRNWGLNMPENTFAGDRSLALVAGFGPDQRPAKLIGFLGLTSQCFNQDSVITTNLSQLQVFFAGVLQQTKIADANNVTIERTPLFNTTARGNSWMVNSQFELMMLDPAHLMSKFIDGTEPVQMGYMVTGRFKSAFPDGIEVKDESDPNSQPKHISGLTEATTDCAVAVFADVDFITDMMAYKSLPLGLGKIPAGDNAALLLNTIDGLVGSTDLISIRSRGSFRRSFTVVDKIEDEAEQGTVEQERRINAEIAGFRQQLNQILASAQRDQQEVIGSAILQKRKELELKIHQAQIRLRDLKMQKRERIEQLGARLRNLNTLPGPILVLVIAIVLGSWRSAKKRRYISHASDA